MKEFIKNIEEIILNQNNETNNKVFGINFLEGIKYLIIDYIGNIQNTDLNTLFANLKENNILISDLENIQIKIGLTFYKDSLSKIKSSYQNDTLSIVVGGFKTFTFFAPNNNSVSFPLSKNMGIVISEKTIVSEKIISGSLILDILSKKRSLYIEN